MTKIVATTTPIPGMPQTVIATDFVYDVRQRMVQVRLNDGRVVNSEYYPDSPLRLSFTAPGAGPSGGAKTFQLWTPDTQNPLQDLDGANALITDYVMGNEMDEVLGRVAGSATHAYLTDHIRSVRNLVNSGGVAVNSYTNAAFGAPRSEVEAVANRFRFTGREWDRAAAMQYNRNRHYLPLIGLWTQRDPTGFDDGPNLYAYVQNNPLTMMDPSGLDGIVLPVCIVVTAPVAVPTCVLVGTCMVCTTVIVYITYKICSSREKSCKKAYKACLKWAGNDPDKQDQCDASNALCLGGSLPVIFPPGTLVP